MQIGWLGLGSMGNAMAQNMQGYLTNGAKEPLCFFNRTASRGASLRGLGAKQYNSVADVVRASDIIFLSLSDDLALKEISQTILSSGQLDGKIIVDTTTVHPDTTKHVAEAVSSANGHFVAAPVFGATPVAQAGKLLIAVSGQAFATQKVIPLLRGALARDVLVVSETPEKAVVLKTIGNFMIAGIMEVVAEAHIFAEKSGIEPNILENLIEQNFGQLAFSDSRRMTQGIYIPKIGDAPYSGLDLALKDVGHGLSSANGLGVKLEVAELVMQNLQKAKKYSDNHNSRPLDSSSMYGVLREEAGLDFQTDFVKDRDGEGFGTQAS